MRANYENFFTDLGNSCPYLKAAFQGFAGGGKTFTAAKLAGGLHRTIKSEKPIIVFDTETSAKFLKPFFTQHKIDVRVKESRKLSDLIDTMDYCANGGADILLIDSITHVWENFLEAYKEKKGRQFLQFQDWGFIKPVWKKEFSDRLVMGRYHIVFTGRQGDMYETVENDAGKMELVKSGVKMKAETETAYEPDLLVRMDIIQEKSDDGNWQMFRQATVLKDRSNLIDGKTFRNPSFKDFQPVVQFLLADSSAPKETVTGNDKDLIQSEQDNHEKKRQQAIWLERCQTLLDKHCGGQKKEDKQRRIEMMEYAFHGETSELAISVMSSEQLEEAHSRLKDKLEPVGVE